jgi:hypothetical protein
VTDLRLLSFPCTSPRSILRPISCVCDDRRTARQCTTRSEEREGECVQYLAGGEAIRSHALHKERRCRRPNSRRLYDLYVDKGLDVMPPSRGPSAVFRPCCVCVCVCVACSTSCPQSSRAGREPSEE